ncbi:hypothetical protein [Mesorhizobium sp. M1D.F.Ca.ET.043.01.1.1]|uniref:hypothetical protein n=1 Tax=Mesorhizobium sp. M1D.F.Ca.ET.043.01.1.1 TaxID=2493669 RepID=UPI001AECA060|nr:hypothetical protein [Mesorhizobium sp. M1D.F.Ca.ET.043.01.1.1]
MPKHGRLDMVHLEEIGEFGEIALYGAAFEFVEGLFDLRAVIHFHLRFAHPDAAAFDVKAVADVGELVLDPHRLPTKRLEMVRVGVLGHEIPERDQPA